MAEPRREEVKGQGIERSPQLTGSANEAIAFPQKKLALPESVASGQLIHNLLNLVNCSDK